MKIYITGLPSGYEVEHLARLFYPMAPLTLTPPEPAEDCLWAEKTDTGLRVLVRQGEKSKTLEAPLPLPVEQGGETPEFALASLTYDLLRQWTGIRPPWGKMTGVRPVRLIHDKRAAGWSAEQIDRFFLQRFDCSEQKYEMAKEIADLQEPILQLGSAPKTYSLYIGIPFCPSRCSYCSFVSCNLDRDRKLVQPYVDCLCKEVAEIRVQAERAGLTLCSIYIGGGTPTSLSAAQLRQLMGTVRDRMYPLSAADCGYTEGEQIAVDELRFTAWHTPGHTPGSVVLLCGEHLFCGDTLFAGSIGRTDLEGGSSAQMADSLRKLAQLPIPRETQVLPGHGEFSTFGAELDNNYYIRSALRGGNDIF